MKKFFQEFKEFAMRGNVLDMAVGVVVGSAFTAIVTSIVQNLLTPLLGLLIPDSTFAEWAPGGFGIGDLVVQVRHRRIATIGGDVDTLQPHLGPQFTT